MNVFIIVIRGKVEAVFATEAAAKQRAQELRAKRQELQLNPRMLEILKRAVETA